jgi:hypothetical protein
MDGGQQCGMDHGDLRREWPRRRGNVGFSAAGNSGGALRDDTIGGQTFTVNEAACSYTVTPASLNVSYPATTGTFTVCEDKRRKTSRRTAYAIPARVTIE